MVIARRKLLLSVQMSRLGQGTQPVRENFTLMASFLRLSITGVQLLLRRPSGHVAVSPTQSTWKWRASKRVSRAFCQ